MCLSSRPPVLDSATTPVSSLEHAFFLGFHIWSPPPQLSFCFSLRGEPTLGPPHVFPHFLPKDPPCWGALVSSTHFVSLAWSFQNSLGVHEPCRLVLSELETGLSAFLFKVGSLFFLGNPESFHMRISDFHFRILKREMCLQVASMTKSCTLS